MQIFTRLHRALCFVGLGIFLAPIAHADYPERSIRIIVSQQAGGATDQLARMWAQNVSKSLGVAVVVENRPGAGGTIAAQYVLSQPADGYTLFLAGISQMVLNKFVYKPLAYSPEQDFTGVGMLTNVPFILVTNPDSGLTSLDKLKQAAQAEPEKITFASAGNGNSTHLVGEMFMQQTDIRMLHIPFRGQSDGLAATVGGTTDVMTPVFSSALPMIKEGKLIPLVLFNDTRHPELPDVPTAKELGLMGFENVGWSAIAAKTGTPDDIIQKLHSATQTFLNDPEALERMRFTQVLPIPGPASQLVEFITQDTQKWQDVIGNLNLNIN